MKAGANASENYCFSAEDCGPTTREGRAPVRLRACDSGGCGHDSTSREIPGYCTTGAWTVVFPAPTTQWFVGRSASSTTRLPKAIRSTSTGWVGTGVQGDRWLVAHAPRPRRRRFGVSDPQGASKGHARRLPTLSPDWWRAAEVENLETTGLKSVLSGRLI